MVLFECEHVRVCTYGKVVWIAVVLYNACGRCYSYMRMRIHDRCIMITFLYSCTCCACDVVPTVGGLLSTRAAFTYISIRTYIRIYTYALIDVERMSGYRCCASCRSEYVRIAVSEGGRIHGGISFWCQCSP